MEVISEERRKRYSTLAIRYYDKADDSKWLSAAMCNQIVGKYARYATEGLSQDMNCSVDTIEDMAHAYELYAFLKMFDARYVRNARKMKGIYMSHFRSLYRVRRVYFFNGKDEKDVDYATRMDAAETIMELLVDIVQSVKTGDPISSRDVEQHAMNHYGLKRPWGYYGKRAAKAMKQALECEDLNDRKRKALKRWYKSIDAWTK